MMRMLWTRAFITLLFATNLFARSGRHKNERLH